jgi:hypothetical protein
MAEAHTDRKRGSAFADGAAIFSSAFLLFQIQLIVAKHFLPWFGGTPSMWTTCMFFFQLLLVGGYLYAHLITKHLQLRSQGALHLVVIFATFIVLLLCSKAWSSPLLPDSGWKPRGPENPVWHLSVLLAISAGVPFFLLSTTGPLLQSWFAVTQSGGPYRLYALSNLGSFAGLLSYPFVFEPRLTLRTQAWLWLAGFLCFALLCGFCARRLKSKAFPRSVIDIGEAHNDSATRPSFGQLIFWLVLASCGSVLFLATTNQICLNIAVVPLLWVLPLSIYLLSLAICFDRPRWYSRVLFHPALVASLVLAVFLLNGGAIRTLVAHIIGYSLILFVLCMVCHGELARSKPSAQHLTSFYLMVALGGAVAGVFVVLIAPRVFSLFWEYQLGLWLTVLMAFVALARDRASWLHDRFGLPAIAVFSAMLPASILLTMHNSVGPEYWFLIAILLAALYITTRGARPGFDENRARAIPWFVSFALLVLGVVLILSTRLQLQGAKLLSRNFYGTLTVTEVNGNDPEWSAYALSHGIISHGFQFRAPSKRSIPTSYYGTDSGVGRAIAELRESRGGSDPDHLRFGVVGLGVGTLAAYARLGDYVRFYEINPAVIQIAGNQTYFSYLANCRAKLDIVSGDARLSMERELERGLKQNFDLLVIDAFSGDAPPIHLLTKQAFRIYLNEADRSGIIAVHITNTFVDLRRVIGAVAEELGVQYRFMQSDGDSRITKYNDWALLWQDSGRPGINPAPTSTAAFRERVRPWTDDYSNLFQVLR